MFFSGQHVANRKVDLRGRSRGEESREEILERTRVEREQRRRAKLESKAGTVIQAFWRSHLAAQAFKQELRHGWVAVHGVKGEKLGLSNQVDDIKTVRSLLVFCQPKDRIDVTRLASVCRTLLSDDEPKGLMVAFQPHVEGVSVAAYRVTRLLQLAIEAVVSHRSEFQPILAGQRPTQVGPMASDAVPLIECIIRMASPDFWLASMGQGEAAIISANILKALAGNGLFLKLAWLLLCATAGRVGQTKTYTETLITQLVVRALSVKDPVSQGSAAGLHHLLSVPSLWRACGSLVPVAGRLCRTCTLQLQACLERCQTLAAVLHEGVSSPPLLKAGWPLLQACLERCQTLAAVLDEGVATGGRAGAAAALLGNLLEAGGRMLQQERPPQLQATALATTEVLSGLLALLPLRPFFAWAGLEEDAELPSTCPRLKWDDEEMAPAEAVAQVRLLGDASTRDLLKLLVPALLPHTTPQQSDPAELRAVSRPIRALCRLVQQLLALPALRQQLLLSLAVSAGLVQRLWYSYLRAAHIAGVKGVADSWAAEGLEAGEPGWMLPLVVLAPVMSSYMLTSELEEFYVNERPLALSELHSAAQPFFGLVHLLKTTLWQVLWLEFDRTPPTPSAAALRAEFRQQVGRLLGLIYDRNCRHSFAPLEAFHAINIVSQGFVTDAASSFTEDAARREAGEATATSRIWTVLEHAPCLVPFQERAKVFQSIVQTDREEHRDAEIRQMMEHGVPFEQTRFVAIRRDNLLLDGYDHLNRLGEGLKSRVRIQFIDEYGMAEAGVDGGGLFKDFMDEVIRAGFDPEFGLFKQTANHQLYPNPAAFYVADAASALRNRQLLQFMGRMVGKALYEGLLLELPFAAFFLKKFRGAHCDVNDLPTLDAEVYSNLMKLRHYSGDVAAELGLTFTAPDATRPNSGAEVELRTGGANIPVTNDNVIDYVHRAANYRLNVSMQSVTEAFLSGFTELIPPQCLVMFNEAELQMLISGSEEGLDIADMKAHTNYAGGYHEDHPVVLCFWSAVESFTVEQQRLLLKFVTACSRAPLLGFKYLEPNLCIQMAGGVLDPSSTDRLPTAATCHNLLKLPPYRNLQQMRDKLLYSIESGAGFDLS